jgi:hypothetical protein
MSVRGFGKYLSTGEKNAAVGIAGWLRILSTDCFKVSLDTVKSHTLFFLPWEREFIVVFPLAFDNLYGSWKRAQNVDTAIAADGR